MKRESKSAAATLWIVGGIIWVMAGCAVLVSVMRSIQLKAADREELAAEKRSEFDDGYARGLKFGAADYADGIPHRGVDWMRTCARVQGRDSRHPLRYAAGFYEGYAAGIEGR